MFVILSLKLFRVTFYYKRGLNQITGRDKIYFIKASFAKPLPYMTDTKRYDFPVLIMVIHTYIEQSERICNENPWIDSIDI